MVSICMPLVSGATRRARPMVEVQKGVARPMGMSGGRCYFGVRQQAEHDKLAGVAFRLLHSRGTRAAGDPRQDRGHLVIIA